MEDDAESVQFISPNGYPNQYPNNGFKLLDIRVKPDYVVAVDIESFELQSGDYIHVGDGVDSFYNNSVEHGKWLHLTGEKSNIWHYTRFTSNSSSLKLIFTSDWSRTDAGFIITCSALTKHRQVTTTNAGRYFLLILCNCGTSS